MRYGLLTEGENPHFICHSLVEIQILIVIMQQNSFHKIKTLKVLLGFQGFVKHLTPTYECDLPGIIFNDEHFCGNHYF